MQYLLLLQNAFFSLMISFPQLCQNAANQSERCTEMCTPKHFNGSNFRSRCRHFCTQKELTTITLRETSHAHILFRSIETSTPTENHPTLNSAAVRLCRSLFAVRNNKNHWFFIVEQLINRIK